MGHKYKFAYSEIRESYEYTYNNKSQNMKELKFEKGNMVPNMT